MKKHSDEIPDWQGQRDKIIGLGESSIRKSYYPELQEKLAELERKNADLKEAYENLTSGEEELRQNYEEISAKEHELRESEEKYRNLIENSSDVIYIIQDEHFVFFNQVIVEVYGFTPEELWSMHPADLLHPDDREPVQKFNSELFSRRISRSKFISRTITKYGEVHIFEFSESLILFKGKPAIFGVGRDATERENVVQTLRESEEKYRNLIENTFDGVVIVSHETIVFANNTAARLFGCTGPGELIGVPIRDLVHPDYFSLAKERTTHAVETTQMPIHEKFLHRDGTVFDVEVVTVPTMWERLPAAQSAFRDITGQKRAEEALKESEIFYRTLFETTGAATILIEADTIVSRANEKYARMTGYTREEIEGKRSWTEFVVPEDLEWMKGYHKDRRVAPQNVPQVYEFRLVNRNGRIYHCLCTVSMIPGTARSIASVADITDRVSAQQELEKKNRELLIANEELAARGEELKQNYEELRKTERELRSAKTFMQAIYDGSPDMIMVHNTEGRIIEMNHNAVKGYGYTLDEMTNLRPEMASGSGYTDEMGMARIRQAFEEGAADFEWAGRRKTGEEFPVEVRLRRIESETAAGLREPRVLAIVRDITERRMADSALEQARKKLGLLNTIIFQDIQSTIFALSAYMQLAASDHEGVKAKSYAEKQAFLIHKIISSLNFARNYQELGVQPSRWQNVNQVFLYAISHLDSLKISRTVQLNNLEIYADPLLEKVFFNLIENIFLHGQKATGLSFTYREDSTGLLLLFQDDGLGIPAEEKKKIFERGYGKNTGLGLYLAREILSITGISIHETGVEGGGARFEIFVPKGAYRFSMVK